MDQKLFNLVYDIAKLIRITGNERLAMSCYELAQQLFQDGASPSFIGTTVALTRRSVFNPNSSTYKEEGLARFAAL